MKTPCIDCGRSCRGKRCRKCYREWMNSPEERRRQSRRWSGDGNPMRRPEIRAKKAEISRSLWQDPEYAAKVTAGVTEAMNRPEVVARNRETTGALHAAGVYDTMFASEEYRRGQSEAQREAQNRPEVVARNRETTGALHAAGVYAHLPGLLSGENNGNWRGGVSLKPYGPEFNDELKRSARDRDGHVCVVCDLPEGRQAHDVHHEDYDKENNDLDNLITLCKSCHSKTGSDREFWQSYFEGQVYLAMGAC